MKDTNKFNLELTFYGDNEPTTVEFEKPKTYKELADLIFATQRMHINGERYIDENILKNIIKNFKIVEDMINKIV